MRLLELVLDRYGPFDGLRLSFDPQARAHIVHGPNEAGKTSALAALGDLFYGPPRRAEIGFLRPKDLRIGATLQGRNGQILQFTRRRGDRNALLDAAGAALPDDALAPFLGAATRDIFERAFGLDAANLRTGGADMLRNDGEIGASLLAAASGLRGLIDLKKEFATEAEAIFGERKAGHRSFYQALDRFDAARAQERAATLSDATIKALQAEVEGAGEAIAAIENARRLAQAERQRLARLLKAAPLLRNLARLRAEHAQDDALAALPSDWARQATGALAAWQAAGEAANRTRQSHDAARRDAEETEVDETVLAQAAKIEDLIRASGAYDKSAADLPRRDDALREARQVLLRRAQECGLSDAEALKAAAPDAAMLKQAEKLAGRGRELEQRSEDPRRTLAEEEALFARLRAEQALAPELDAARLREKLVALGQVAQWDGAWREARFDAEETTRFLAEKCARLTPPLCDLDLFAGAPSPDAAAIEQAARAFEDLDARESAARRKAEEATATMAAAQTSLAQLERQGAVASIDAMRRARDERDADWLDLRALLLAPGEPVRPDRTGRFEALVARADASADALRADAARAAAAEGEREKIAGARRDCAEAEKLLAGVAEARARQSRDWADAWTGCGVAPRAPREMISWRSRADALLDAREALLRQKAKAREWETLLAKAQPNLEALSQECGLSRMDNLESAALARRIEARLAEIDKARDAAREAQAKIADAPIRIDRLKQRLAQLDEEKAAWRAEWRVALERLRLDEDAGFDEAQRRIALWRSLPGAWEDEAEKVSRARKIAFDLEDFEQGLDALLALCARDVPSRPVGAAVAQLRDRLSLAREKSALRQKARERLALAAAEEEEARTLFAEAEQALLDCRVVAAQSGLDAEPEPLLRRLDAREKLRQAIKDELERLFLVADGLNEATLAAEAEQFDADAAHVRLDEIERQLMADDGRKLEIHARLRAAEGELDRLQTSLGAEAAIQAKENARAEIAGEARRWAVLKLASMLVDAGLERSRDRRKDPLLARAGSLFATLTNGRYVGLDQAFGDDDALHLRARRVDGAELALKELSEATQDQLYLSLRLAFLEDHAGRSEAPPFIGDDLFASFDEGRVAAGVRTLAEAGAFLQPILFTHHAHIVEIAQKELGAAAQILRLD